MMSEKKNDSHCTMCGKDAAYHCTCRTVSYCSKTCQKRDWKSHKAHCTASEKRDICTRCEHEIKRGSKCMVPHPASSRHCMGTINDPDVDVKFYCCSACLEVWAETTPKTYHDATNDKSAWTEWHQTSVDGSLLCYVGPHTRQQISPSDPRVISTTDVSLVVNPFLQNQLNALPTTVRRLTIQTGGYRISNIYSFEFSLPQLEALLIDDVKFDKIVLSAELTPKLQDLALINLGDIDDVDFRVTTPSIKHLDISYIDAMSTQAINTMLAACTRLETFSSDGLHVHRQLHFASTELKRVTISDLTCANIVRIYAPKLQFLELHECRSLLFVRIMNDDELSAQLPHNFVQSKFVVDMEGSLCDSRALLYLQGHPRVRQLNPCDVVIVDSGDTDDESDDVDDDEEEDEFTTEKDSA